MARVIRGATARGGRRARARWAVLLAVVIILSACGHTRPADSGNVVSSSPLSSSQSAGGGWANNSGNSSGGNSTSGPASVHGTASTSDGQPVSGVVVGFQQNGCPTCQLYHATTDSSGTYTLSMPAAQYIVVCKLSGGTCTPSTGVSAQISGASEVDLAVVESGAGSPSSSPNTSPGGGNGSSDAILSGHVTDANGQPVAKTAIEIKFVVSGDAYVTTDANGAYTFGDDASLTVGTVLCEPYDPNLVLGCHPVGVTTPVTFDPSQGPRVINWVVTRT